MKYNKNIVYRSYNFMEVQQKKRTYRKKEAKTESIYSDCLLTIPVLVNIKYVGKNTKSLLEKKVKGDIEGKCIVEGYVKTDSSKVISYSSGIVQGQNIRFDVMVQCDVCYPVEGATIQCKAVNITKAGIRGESADESPSPFVCFVSREHHVNSQQFGNISEGDTFTCKVIGQRFELNDSYVSILGEIPIQIRK